MAYRGKEMKLIRTFWKKIKKVGIRITLKQVRDKIFTPFADIYYRLKWRMAILNNKYQGISKVKHPEELIVSLTTYPARINYVHRTIQTLLMQTEKPDRVILWLAAEQFKDFKLPKDLLALQKYGLQILWCADYKSYKKLVPTLKAYPDAVIITADDDLYYSCHMVERLYKAYCIDNNFIQCHRVTKFGMIRGEYVTIPGGYDVYPHASFLHKLTGGSGSLYPPHSLYKDVIDDEMFMRIAPTNDDIWFWIMGLLNGVKCNVVKHSCPALYFVHNSQDDALSQVNDKGQKLFWKQFHEILVYYPEVDAILRQEWELYKKYF